MIDPWEAFQSYQRTAVVLDHFEHELNVVLGGVQTEDGEHRNVQVKLLAGSDLIMTMSEPGVWSHEDVGVVDIVPCRQCKAPFPSSNISLAVTGALLSNVPVQTSTKQPTVLLAGGTTSTLFLS